MPFWVSTNTPGTGMDAPTWRGAYDRWLILPQGRWNVIDLRGRGDRDNSFPERSMWGATLPARRNFWNMVTEGSTGFSGAFARQVTLNAVTSGAALTGDLLDALEVSAVEGGIVLQGEGAFIDYGRAAPVALQFDGGVYRQRNAGTDAAPRSFSRPELVALAAAGRFVGTFIGRLGAQRGRRPPAARHLERGAYPPATRASGIPRPVQCGRQHGDQRAARASRRPCHRRRPAGATGSCAARAASCPTVTASGSSCRSRQDRACTSCSYRIRTGCSATTSFSSGARSAIARRSIVLPVVAAAPLGTRARTPASSEGAAADAGVFTAADGTGFRAETVVTGLEAPTSLDFAPDGRLFVTERRGLVWVLRPGQMRPALALAAGPTELLDLALDPGFMQNRFVYLLHAVLRPGEPPAGLLVRYREVGDTLAQAAVLLDDLPVDARFGGSRLRFGPDSLLYAALGGGGDADNAQNLGSYAGKILRVRGNGATAGGNPFASPVYSLGHRQPGGFDWHPLTGALWVVEPGGAGAGSDEVNRIEAGGNYGWPVIEGVTAWPGMRPPVLNLEPPSVPAGASFYTGTAIPGFRHDLFLATLDGAHLRRIRFDPSDPNRIIDTERLLDGRFGRLSDVVTGPDGGLYVATSNRDGYGTPTPGDDRIIRLVPVR